MQKFCSDHTAMLRKSPINSPLLKISRSSSLTDIVRSIGIEGYTSCTHPNLVSPGFPILQKENLRPAGAFTFLSTPHHLACFCGISEYHKALFANLSFTCSSYLVHASMILAMSSSLCRRSSSFNRSVHAIPKLESYLSAQLFFSRYCMPLCPKPSSALRLAVSFGPA